MLRRRAGDHLEDYGRWVIVAAAAVGAAVGARALTWIAEHPFAGAGVGGLADLMGGKTIVGALLGGLVAVELTKLRTGVTRSTGDLFALPLALAIAIGRIGCFLSGTSDGTHGVETTLRWGLDFGDGVLRHPVRIYEILFLGVLASLLLRLRELPHREGDVFKLFMVGYLAFRLAVDFLKPGNPVLGLTAIQWACIFGLVGYARHLPRLVRPHGDAPPGGPSSG